MSEKIDFHDRPLHWRTRWVLRRNRILGSERFQRWAAKTPVFRTVARRKAARQFDLVAGFVYTQILYIFVRSGLLAGLKDALWTPQDVARKIRLGEAATDRILRAGAALEITESPQSGYWTLGEAGAALSANPGAMAMIEHHQLLYEDLADPFALLSQPGGEGSRLASFWTYAGDQKSPAPGNGNDQAYSALMAATQPMIWQQILGQYDFAKHHKLLDIGGGSGAFVQAVAAVAGELQLAVFDLPAVAPLAHDRFAGSPLENRVSLVPGNFREDPIPPDHDLITLIRILHDHDDPVVRELLAAIHRALPQNGRLLVVEPMAETAGAEAMGDAYFGLYLWAMGSGRPRSLSENRELLLAAGFSRVFEVKTPLPIIARALVAEK